MIKLFKFEAYKLKISEEAFTLKPFRDIWERDKTKSKSIALMELGYIYHFCDPRSDYQYLVDDSTRSNAIIEGEGLDGWKPDKLIKEAIKFYNSFKPSSALLLEDTRYAVDKLRKAIRNVDAEESEDPIKAIKDLSTAIKQIPSLIKELDEAEKSMNSELINNGRVRGQMEKTIMEDSLDD